MGMYHKDLKSPYSKNYLATIWAINVLIKRTDNDQ
nr:MAG TPA_asm: hypothetical protein [Caudoviricetes sp.]DAY72368.1 MAG TPA: hypothetical protein [Caudoviricetes sp.]